MSFDLAVKYNEGAHVNKYIAITTMLEECAGLMSIYIFLEFIYSEYIVNIL